MCGYATMPGYGNGWNQAFCTTNCLTVGTGVTIGMKASWDSEPGYDGTHVEVDQCDNNWVAVKADTFLAGAPATDFLTGASSGVGAFVVPDSLHGTSMRVRIHFTSDGAWSDQDGLWDTNGGIVLDSLSVNDSGGNVVPLENFEGAAVGATSVTNWQSCTPPGYGDFSGLLSGLQMIQEDPCFDNISCIWNWFTGSTYNYACGGFPGQTAMPFGNADGQYLDNLVISPNIPLVGTGASFSLTFDAYRDLALDNLQFYQWHVRSIVAGCAGGFKDRNFVYYGGQKDWLVQSSQPFGDLVEPGATDIQVSFGALDMCGVWCGVYGTGACHSHAPLIDNVNVYRIATTGPQFSVRDIGLFQDNFPADGTLTGTARVDMAQDITASSSPTLLPGDSAVANVSDVVNGLGVDPTFGGAAVYCYVYSTTNGVANAKTGNVLTDDAARWPVTGSAVINGHTWTILRMDTSFGGSGGTTPVADQYCIDLNDSLFTAGDVTWFVFSATDSAGNTNFYSRNSAATDMTVFNNPMEFTILPTGNSDILYVDGMDGRGAQPFFDSAFSGTSVNPDRYDIRGPSSGVANRPGSRVQDVFQQVIGTYKTIIWSTGDLSIGLIGDGTGNPEKSNDAFLLDTFLDQSVTQPVGLYLTGDDIAQTWNSGTGLAGSGPALFAFITHTLASGDHRAAGQVGDISPLGVGDPSGCFAGDTLVYFGGCPLINDFDVLTPTGSAQLQMSYVGSGPSGGSLISQTTVNAQGDTAVVLLEGASFHYIRDAGLSGGVPARTTHLQHVFQCLSQGTGVATPVVSNTFRNSLSQNYPNPFNPQTTISFSLREKSHVSLKIYNVAGALVKTLVNDVRAPGVSYKQQWDGRNNAGQSVSSGVYFYKLVSKNFTQTKKMVLLK